MLRLKKEISGVRGLKIANELSQFFKLKEYSLITTRLFVFVVEGFFAGDFFDGDEQFFQTIGFNDVHRLQEAA